VTDAQGRAHFVTIYPGWYEGRTVHIHFKVRSPSAEQRGFELTSQLYFDDSFSDHVFARPPYAGRGARSMRNMADGIYRGGGSQLLLRPTPQDTGYGATFQVALQGV
jgi:protocatechuate 3,4-dioxygenase beta subunit